MATIELKINANYEEAIKGSQDLTASTKALEKETEDYNKTVQKSMKNAVNATEKQNKTVRRQKGLIEDIEDSIKDWEQALKKATNTRDIEKYNRKIAEGRKDLELYKKRGVPALKAVNKQATIGAGVFSRLGGTIAAVFSVGLIARFAKESARLYDLQIKAERSLELAIGRRSDALLRQARALEAATGIADAEIISQQALAANIGLTEQQIKKLIPAALDLAAGTGKTLNFATLNLLRTFSGVAGELGELIPQLKDFTAEQLRAGAAVEFASEQFRGQAEAAGEVGLAVADKLTNAWVNFREELGRQELDFWNQFLRGLTIAITDVTKAISDANTELDTFFRFVTDEDTGREFYGQLIRQREVYQKQLEIAIKKEDQLAVKQAENQLRINQELLDGITEKFGFNAEVVEDLNEKSNIELKKLADSGNKIAEGILKERRKQFDEHTKEVQRDSELQNALAGIPSNIGKLLENAESEIADFFNQQEPIELEFFLEDEDTIDDEATRLAEKNIKVIQKAQAKLEKFTRDHPFFASLGLESEEQLDALRDVGESITNVIDSIASAWVQNTELIVRTLDTRIAEQQRALDAEIRLAELGVRNNVTLKREELVALQEERDKALADQQQALKVQQGIEAVSQGIALASSVANIIKVFSEIPFVGLALAAGAIATMFAMFSNAKTQIADAVKFEKGGEVRGKRHSDGGVNIEAEDGEFVINRESYRKYPDLVKAINNDELRVRDDLIKNFNISETKLSLKETAEIKEIRDMMRKIMNKKTRTEGNGYVIEEFGNVRRKING